MGVLVGRKIRFNFANEAAGIQSDFFIVLERSGDCRLICDVDLFGACLCSQGYGMLLNARKEKRY